MHIPIRLYTHSLYCYHEVTDIASDVSYLDRDRQEGNEQKVLCIRNQAVTIHIKHLEKLAILPNTRLPVSVQ